VIVRRVKGLFSDRTFGIGAALVLLLLVGGMIIMGIMSRQEEKQNIQDILKKGNYLVSLISLHSLGDFQGEKGRFFLRTLTEYVSPEGLAYCIIHDGTGRRVVSLAPDELMNKIPDKIKMMSLANNGLTNASFELNGSDGRAYEFAKPLFENGERRGTVRLGFLLPPSRLFSPDRMNLLAVIGFLIFAALLFEYYGISLALKPLQRLTRGFRQEDVPSRESASCRTSAGRIAPFLEDLEISLPRIKEKLDAVEQENVRLSSKLGVMAFEKNQVRSILNAMDFGVIVTDIQDNVTHANDYVVHLLKKPREDVLDRPLDEILNHDEIIAFLSQHDTLEHAGSKSHTDLIFSDLAPDETFRVSVSYLGDDEKAPIGKVIFLKNVTSEQASEKAQEGFIAHVAHELLTPLTSIKSYSEMLMEGEIEDLEMRKEFYNTINAETDRLTDLIRNLLNISKMEVGSLILNRGLVRTDWFVESCITPIEAAALEKGITIHKNLPDIFPSIMADKELLKAAVINILGNAVKYTPENGDITFSISENGDKVHFDVLDTGYGISPEDLPHIFDKFYRARDPNVSREAGSGLGLAITSEIVQLHDGEIEVRSGPNEGSQFTIRIPKEDYRIGKQ
jgi:signal transduction histidine kinase